jgi:DNA-binding response OmpR family regulator
LRLLHRRRAVRILVVEDDRIMAGYIQQGLVDQGYTVDVAALTSVATFERSESIPGS